MSTQQDFTSTYIYCEGSSTAKTWLGQDSKGNPHLAGFPDDALAWDLTFTTVGGTSGYYIQISGNSSGYLAGEPGTGAVSLQDKENASLWCFDVAAGTPSTRYIQIVGQAGSNIYLYGNTDSGKGAVSLTSDTSAARNQFIIWIAQMPSCGS